MALDGKHIIKYVLYAQERIRPKFLFILKLEFQNKHGR